MFRVLAVGVDRETSEEVIELAQQEDFIKAAVGIHPNRAKKLDSGELRWFEKALYEKDVIAVGEIGLDYYHEKVPGDVQQYMCHQFVELAHDLHLPMVFHVRPEENNSEQPIFDDLFPILDRHGGKDHSLGIFHCFGGNSRRLTQCLDYQMHVSFAGNVTYPRALELQSVAKEVPMDRLMVETDSPYLSPQPKRNERNQPNYIWPTYEKLAELKDLDVDVMVDKIWENTEKLFGWSPDRVST
jgi:TatD DNase family protein